MATWSSVVSLYYFSFYKRVDIFFRQLTLPMVKKSARATMNAYFMHRFIIKTTKRGWGRLYWMQDKGEMNIKIVINYTISVFSVIKMFHRIAGQYIMKKTTTMTKMCIRHTLYLYKQKVQQGLVDATHNLRILSHFDMICALTMWHYNNSLTLVSSYFFMVQKHFVLLSYLWVLCVQ